MVKKAFLFVILLTLAIGCSNNETSISNGGGSSSEGIASEYTITFDSNGGSGSMESLTVKAGQQQDLPQNTFAKNGAFLLAGLLKKTVRVNILIKKQLM